MTGRRAPLLPALSASVAAGRLFFGAGRDLWLAQRVRSRVEIVDEALRHQKCLRASGGRPLSCGARMRVREGGAAAPHHTASAVRIRFCSRAPGLTASHVNDQIRRVPAARHITVWGHAPPAIGSGRARRGGWRGVRARWRAAGAGHALGCGRAGAEDANECNCGAAAPRPAPGGGPARGPGRARSSAPRGAVRLCARRARRAHLCLARAREKGGFGARARLSSRLGLRLSLQGWSLFT